MRTGSHAGAEDATLPDGTIVAQIDDYVAPDGTALRHVPVSFGDGRLAIDGRGVGYWASGGPSGIRAFDVATNTTLWTASGLSGQPAALPAIGTDHTLYVVMFQASTPLATLEKRGRFSVPEIPELLRELRTMVDRARPFRRRLRHEPRFELSPARRAIAGRPRAHPRRARRGDRRARPTPTRAHAPLVTVEFARAPM